MPSRNCPQLSECVYISIDNLFIDGGEFIERDAFDPDNKVCVYLGEESNNFKGNKQYFVAGLFDEDYVFKESGVTYVCYDPNMTGDMKVSAENMREQGFWMCRMNWRRYLSKIQM